MENKKYQWVDQILGWESEKDGRPYISLTFAEDMSLKKGDKIYLNQNPFIHKNPKAPKWKKSRKVEDNSLDGDFKDDLDQAPF